MEFSSQTKGGPPGEGSLEDSGRPQPQPILPPLQENELSFLDSPEVVWKGPEVDQKVTFVDNAGGFYYYGKGRVMDDRDMCAILGESSGGIGVEVARHIAAWDVDGDVDQDSQPRPAYAAALLASLSSKATNVVYDPLPTFSSPTSLDCGHIRILEILPAPPHASELDTPPLLNCRLHVVPLSSATGSYEALSYTWRGDSELYEKKPESLWLNGVQYPCGTNLLAALMTLRWQDGKTSRFLWADALCVNQKDLEERSNQVKLMSEIFGRARRVIVWMGTAQDWHGRDTAEEVQKAFEGVCSIVNSWAKRGELLDRVPVARYATTASGFCTFADTPEPPVLTAESPIWWHVFHLYTRRWFHRVWVIQEAALARRAVVVWGPYSISWEWVGLAAAIIRTNYTRLSASSQLSRTRPWQDSGVPMGVLNAYFMYRISASSRFYEPLRFSFHRLLALSRQFQCQENRDHIYGLLGLPMTDEDLVARKIIPDYERTTGEVYMQLAELLIGAITADRRSQGGSLSILSSVQRRSDAYKYYKNGPTDFDWSLPSWVPQWHCVLTQTLIPPEPHPAFDCCLGRAMVRRMEGNDGRSDAYSPNEAEKRKALVVRGVVIDTISAKRDCDAFHMDFIRGQQAPNRRNWSMLVSSTFESTEEVQTESSGPTITRAKLEHLAMTLTAGRNWYGLPVQDVSAHTADFARCLVKKGLLWTLGESGFGAMRRKEINTTVHDGKLSVTTRSTMGHTHTAEHVFAPDCLKVPDRVQQPEESHEDSLPLSQEALEELGQGGNADRFLDAAATVLSRRVLFTTAGGYKGVGPRAASPGDRFCILYGSSVPFVVRHTGEAYQLMGECYVRDIMQGEALEKLGGKLEEAETWIQLV